jgi:ferredoxin-NADP reductase
MMSHLIPVFLRRLIKPRERFRIVAMDNLAPRVLRIRFEPASGLVRPYRPGEFLFVRFDIPGLPHRDRPFTISNPPGSSCLEILVKGTDDWTLALYDRAEAFPEFQGNHRGIRGIRLGEKGQSTGAAWLAVLDYPYGNFTTEGAGTGPWVFLASGMGIAPFLAMAGGRLREDAQVLILWAADNRDELAGFEQLAAINARRPSIRIIPILGHDPMWTGRRGCLDRQALEDLAGRELADPQTRYWISCPAPVRAALVRILDNIGIPRKRIRYQDCAS